MPPKILLHGSGGIGSVYVYLLHEAGYDVTAVCRSNYDAAKSDGFLIDSDRYGKGIRFHPKVVRTPAEAAKDGQYDYVIVSTKALPDANASRVIEPAVTEGKTMIVLIQNGIGIEDEYAELFPRNPTLSCVVYLPTTQVTHGHIQMGNFESLEVGTFPASAYKEKPEVKKAADDFMEILRKSGSQAKCPGADKLIWDVMLEVVAIARALGYDSITAEAADEQLKRAGGRVGGKGIEPSMLNDVLTERRMEVEIILGNPVKIAKGLGIEVPRLELLYGLTKALDEAVALRQPGKSLSGDETKAEKEKRDGKSTL